LFEEVFDTYHYFEYDNDDIATKLDGFIEMCQTFFNEISQRETKQITLTLSYRGPTIKESKLEDLTEAMSNELQEWVKHYYSDSDSESEDKPEE